MVVKVVDEEKIKELMCGVKIDANSAIMNRKSMCPLLMKFNRTNRFYSLMYK